LPLYQPKKRDFHRFLIGFGVSVNDIAGPRNQFYRKHSGKNIRLKILLWFQWTPHPRLLDGITILPWKIFPEKLWAGDLIK
jgi:hypothetical protein